MKIHLKSLDPSVLEDFRSLLGGSEFGGCFCAVWSSHDETWISRCKDPSQPNFEITKQNVLKGKHAGYLVYDEESLVGWTGSGPKSVFPFLKTKLGSRLSDAPDTTWSLGCIAVRESARGKGLSEKIVTAVVLEAQKHGAKILEAYPTRPWDEQRSFRGSHRMFERMGFKEIGAEKDDGSEILLLQLPLKIGGAGD